MSEQAEKTPAPGVLMGILITAVILAIIIGWIVLGTVTIGITSFYASFLFGWFWISIEEGAFPKWLPCTVGAFVGLAFSWAAHFLPVSLGALNGTLVIVAALAVLIFLQLMNWVPIAVNRCTMLFLTVLGAPALLSSMNFGEVAAAIGASALYFAAVMKLVQLYVARAQRPTVS
jgi:hypothetical protein